MPRARSPKRDEAYQLWLASGKKKKLKEIASELGVSENQIRKWKNQDKWNGNVTNLKSNVTKQKNGVKEKVVEESISSVMENTELTDKQRLFCCIYVRCFNATKAYQKAYGVNYNTAISAGPRLLGNVRVKNEIQRLKQVRLNREMLDESDIFQKYIDIAFADITDYIEFGREKIPITGPHGPITVKDEDGNETELEKEVNSVRFKESTDVDGTIITEVKQGRDGTSIKLADRMKALDWLADHMDLATEEQRARIGQMRANTEKLQSDTSSEETELVHRWVEGILKERGKRDDR